MRLLTLTLLLSLLTTVFSGAMASSSVDVVAKVKAPLGNITVTPNGRMIVSLSQFFNPHNRVMELKPDGTLTWFPNKQWNRGCEGDQVPCHQFDSVLGVQADKNGIVWLLDNAMRNKTTPKLVGWDSKDNTLFKIIYLPAPITKPNSFLNDLAVDTDHHTIYIADTAQGSDAALIVVDTHTGTAQRVLEGHQSVVAESLELMIEGRPVQIKQPDGSIIKPKIGVNPIALDSTNQWLYFGPMHSTSMYRVPTDALRNTALSHTERGEKVTWYSRKPISDGISMDTDNNIYVTDVASNAIGLIDAQRHYQKLTTDHTVLSWPDAFSFGPDGQLYIVSNQLHRSAALNGGDDISKPYFYVLRLRPKAPGTIGR